MTWRNSTDRYGFLAIGLHWIMVLLMVAVYACINLSDAFPRGSGPREALKAWHYTLGLCVLALAGLRLIARLADRTPVIRPQPPRWQLAMASVAHVLLYVFMIGLPIVGWLLLSARGKPILLFGMALPALIAENRSLSKIVKEIHETLGTAGYALVALHAAAALFHHYVERDDTLRRMLPKRG